MHSLKDEVDNNQVFLAPMRASFIDSIKAQVQPCSLSASRARAQDGSPDGVGGGSAK